MDHEGSDSSDLERIDIDERFDQLLPRKITENLAECDECYRNRVLAKAKDTFLYQTLQQHIEMTVCGLFPVSVSALSEERIRRKEPSCTKKGSLFGGEKIHNKILLRPSVVDRALRDGKKMVKIPSSTPMICNRKATFAPNDTSFSPINKNPDKSIQSFKSVISVSSGTNLQEQTQGPHSNISERNKKTLENIVANLSEAKARNCSLAVHKTVQTSDKVVNKSLQTSSKISDARKLARNPLKTQGKERQTQTGDSLRKFGCNANQLSSTSSSDSSSFNAFFEKNLAECSLRSAKNEKRPLHVDLGKPWRAPSGLKVLENEDSEQVILEESLENDDTFLPKKPTVKKEYKKKRASKSKRRSSVLTKKKSKDAVSPPKTKRKSILSNKKRQDLQSSSTAVPLNQSVKDKSVKFSEKDGLTSTSRVVNTGKTQNSITENLIIPPPDEFIGSLLDQLKMRRRLFNSTESECSNRKNSTQEVNTKQHMEVEPQINSPHLEDFSVQTTQKNEKRKGKAVKGKGTKKFQEIPELAHGTRSTLEDNTNLPSPVPRQTTDGRRKKHIAVGTINSSHSEGDIDQTTPRNEKKKETKAKGKSTKKVEETNNDVLSTLENNLELASPLPRETTNRRRKQHIAVGTQINSSHLEDVLEQTTRRNEKRKGTTAKGKIAKKCEETNYDDILPTLENNLELASPLPRETIDGKRKKHIAVGTQISHSEDVFEQTTPRNEKTKRTTTKGKSTKKLEETNNDNVPLTSENNLELTSPLPRETTDGRRKNHISEQTTPKGKKKETTAKGKSTKTVQETNNDDVLSTLENNLELASPSPSRRTVESNRRPQVTKQLPQAGSSTTAKKSRKKSEQVRVTETENDTFTTPLTPKPQIRKRKAESSRSTAETTSSETATYDQPLRRSTRERRPPPPRGSVMVCHSEKLYRQLVGSSKSRLRKSGESNYTNTSNSRRNKCSSFMGSVRSTNTFLPIIEEHEPAISEPEATTGTSNFACTTESEEKSSRRSVRSGRVEKKGRGKNSSKKAIDSITPLILTQSTSVTDPNHIMTLSEGGKLHAITWLAPKPKKFNEAQDGVSITVTINNPAHGNSSGYLNIDPGKSKPRSSTSVHDMFFFVVQGVGEARVRDKVDKITIGDTFTVPQGSEYSIQNTNKRTRLTLFFARTIPNEN